MFSLLISEGYSMHACRRGVARTVYLVTRKSVHSARGGRARVSVNFRKFSPRIARGARSRGLDSLPSLSDVWTLSFRWIIHFWYFCLQTQYKAKLALYCVFKQKYQKGFYSPKAKSSNVRDFLRTKYTVLNLVKLVGMRKDAYSTVDRLYAH